MTGPDSTCEKPGCSRVGEKTYNGTKGNKLRVCSMHYWKLTTGNTPVGIGADLPQRDPPTPDIHIDPRPKLEMERGDINFGPYFHDGIDIPVQSEADR